VYNPSCAKVSTQHKKLGSLCHPKPINLELSAVHNNGAYCGTQNKNFMQDKNFTEFYLNM